MQSFSDHITIDSPHFRQSVGAREFQSLYLDLRKKEGRLYSDEELRELPSISPEHLHSEEWRTRKRSAERLLMHIQKLKRPLKVLEIGCGNGWLANRLAEINDTEVTGIDVNTHEILQARRVFGSKGNLHFIVGDPRSDRERKLYDIILFAASIQYFESFRQIISHALSRLSRNGSIHIMDSFFYSLPELGSAIQRTENYYENLGFKEMSAHYFHHTLEELKEFNPDILYDPNSIINRFLRQRDAFSWYRIRKMNSL